MFRKGAIMPFYFEHLSLTSSGFIFCFGWYLYILVIQLQGHGSCRLLCPGTAYFCPYYAVFISYTILPPTKKNTCMWPISAFFKLISLPCLTWTTYYDKKSHNMPVIQTSLQNLPSTAHGKLKAVITPTIPRGFHTCGIPSSWPTLSLNHIITHHM